MASKDDTKKILFIERDQFYVEVLGAFTRLFLNIAFTIVGNAREAADHISAKPDLIIVDLDGDPEDALDFVATRSSDPDTKRIPILGLSKHASIRDRAIGQGCAGFLTKPFKVRELEVLVKKLREA